MPIEPLPIASGDNVANLLFALEIDALVRGIVSQGEIGWDDDSLVEWYIDHAVAPGELEAYREEYRTALDEAKGAILSELIQEIDRKVELLGPVYPFKTNMVEGILLEREIPEHCLPQTICYLWLALFRASQEKNDLLTVTAVEKANIRSLFEKAFEIISAYAVMGRADGPAWYFGSSRSVKKLLRILTHVTRRVRSGAVKQYEQLQENQLQDNDGGVDALLIERRDDATAFLIGATIQLSDRRKKIVGPEAILRFNDYFVNRITAAIQGVLTVPYDKTDREKINCAAKNCLYFHADLIIEYLGNIEWTANRETRHLRLNLRKLSSDLIKALNLADADPFNGCAWV
jgi:hypothetical protein